MSANKRRSQTLLLTAAFAADRMAAQHAGIFAYRSADCAREVGPRRAVRYGQFRLGALGRLPAGSAIDAVVGIPLAGCGQMQCLRPFWGIVISNSRHSCDKQRCKPAFWSDFAGLSRAPADSGHGYP